MKIPSGELRCVSYYGGKECTMQFVMTSKYVGGGCIYTLYKALDGGGDYERLGRGPSPLELESKFHIQESIT